MALSLHFCRLPTLPTRIFFCRASTVFVVATLKPQYKKWGQRRRRPLIFSNDCHLHSYIHTYLLTPWSRVVLEKLTDSQLVKKFPAFYRTRIFITAFTSARHLSIFWASSIQFIPPLPTSWRSILILSSHLRLDLPQWSLSLRFPHQNPVHASPLPHTHYMSRPSHSSRFHAYIKKQNLPYLRNSKRCTKLLFVTRA